jgi:hypothetical protein
VVVDVLQRVLQVVSASPYRGDLALWQDLALRNLEVLEEDELTFAYARASHVERRTIELVTEGAKVAAVVALAVDLLLGVEMPRPRLDDPVATARWGTQCLDAVADLHAEGRDDEAELSAAEVLGACPALASLFDRDPVRSACARVQPGGLQLAELLRAAIDVDTLRRPTVDAVVEALDRLRDLEGPTLDAYFHQHVRCLEPASTCVH